MRTVFFLTLLISTSLSLNAQKLTIVHTNDMHSRLLGFAPNADYSPLTTGDDETIGGFARLATLIGNIREQGPDQVLVLDGGDFTMGTLFHTLETKTGFQLWLMKQMGYDAVTIGNHEFDWGIENLGDIIARSAIRGEIPSLLLSNIQFSDTEKEDDLLENLMDQGVVKPYEIVERNGLRIGLFGLLGEEAAMVAPYVKPARFTDQVEKAREIATYLKNDAQVDIVICQSHSGVWKDKKGNWGGEDVELVKAIPEIDVVISGHTHTRLTEPIVIGNQIIVQAGSEGRFLGRVDLNFENGVVELESATLIPINDDIPGDPRIQRLIEEQQKRIGESILGVYGFKIDEPLVETGFDLEFNEETNVSTSNLGPFVADALYWYAKKIEPEGTDLALIPGGTIRDQIRKGKTGQQLPADLFRILPLGSGVYDDSPGYSMVKIYLTGREVKTVLEVMLLAPRISSGNYAFWSGVKFKQNSLRMPLDQVYEVMIGNPEDGYEPIKLSKSTDRLYGLITNAYVLEFFGLIQQITKGILKVEPKFADGTVMTDLKASVIDRDPETEGLQEAKEWAGLMSYAAQLPDLNGNGIPDIPDYYRESHIAVEKKASINPVKYFKATNGITLVPFLAAGIITGGTFLILAL